MSAGGSVVMASRLNPAVSPQRRRRGRFVELRDGRTLKHALQLDRFDASDLTRRWATALDSPVTSQIPSVKTMEFNTVENDAMSHVGCRRRDEREWRCGGVRRDDSLLH